MRKDKLIVGTDSGVSFCRGCNTRLGSERVRHTFKKSHSVEIPTKCSFVMEFIISEFIEGSTRFEQHTTHHQEL
jgi:hypothetical protein